MRISDFNVTQLDYNTQEETSGIYLIESIQNLKYYIYKLQMRTEFNVHFDFGGLVTNNQMPMFDKADISN